MKQLWWSFVLCTFTLVACDSSGGATDEESIQGGRADSGDPAVGLLWFQSGGFCSGTLITPSVVLTAAHCIADPIAAFYTGKGRATTQLHPPTGMVEHAVDDQVAHPGYNGDSCPSRALDLGLVHLATPVENIAPVPIDDGSPDLGIDCTAVGFGAHDQGGNQYFMQKRSAVETIIDQTKTAFEVELNTGIADHGDSGGPLICENVITGTASCHTDGDPPAHKTSYVARVDAGANWIRSTIKRWGS